MLTALGSAAVHGVWRSFSWAGLEQAGLGQAGLDQAGLDQAGLGQAGLDQAGLDQAGLEQAGLDQAALLASVCCKMELPDGAACYCYHISRSAIAKSAIGPAPQAVTKTTRRNRLWVLQHVTNLVGGQGPNGFAQY